ncbi:hypothetical protein [Allorhodopirellula solitaria]|nr:hypothetical protein [Allorhodopirellula solitaria]
MKEISAAAVIGVLGVFSARAEDAKTVTPENDARAEGDSSFAFSVKGVGSNLFRHDRSLIRLGLWADDTTPWQSRPRARFRSAPSGSHPAERRR